MRREDEPSARAGARRLVARAQGWLIPEGTRDAPVFWRQAALVVGLGLACGALGEVVGLPLPWMIGGMVAAAGLKFSGRAVALPRPTRATGQVLVAGSVGLAFTPEAVTALGDLLVPMVAVAVLTVVAGFLAAGVLMKLARIDAISASLASVPIGPVETANLAGRYGIAPGPVVLAQTLRIVLLIALFPPLMVALDGTIADPSAALRAQSWTLPGAVLMALCALAGALLAQRLRVSNPFFVGALGGSAGAAALSLPVTALPWVVLLLAQLALGLSLGAIMDRGLLRESRRFLPAVLASTVLMVILCTAMGLAVAALTGLPWQVAILSTAPGSVTEMALTAKILQQGVAVVTAFHVVRIFIIVPAAPLIFALAARGARRFGLLPATDASRGDPPAGKAPPGA